MLLGLKILLRKEWIAAIAFVAIFAGLNSGGRYPAAEIPASLVIYAIAVFIVYRYGLIPLVVAISTVDMLADVPFSADISTWYMTTSILALLSVVAVAAWGFYHSLGGAPFWEPQLE